MRNELAEPGHGSGPPRGSKETDYYSGRRHCGFIVYDVM